MVYAWVLAWQHPGVFEEGAARIWKRVAYAVRYGKGVTLTEALTLEHDDLSALVKALSEIVQEENAKA